MLISGSYTPILHSRVSLFFSGKALHLPYRQWCQKCTIKENEESLHRFTAFGWHNGNQDDMWPLLHGNSDKAKAGLIAEHIF